MNWDVLEAEVTSVVVCEAKAHPGESCSGILWMTRFACPLPLCAYHRANPVQVLCDSYIRSLIRMERTRCVSCGVSGVWDDFYDSYFML